MTDEEKQRTSRWDKLYGTLEKVSIKFVLTACCLAGILFTFWAGVSSNKFPDDYMQEMAQETPDSLLGNLLFWFVGIVLIWGLWKLLSLGVRENEEKLQKRLHLLVIILCILLGGILLVWVHITHYTMLADQENVYGATLEFAQGDYSSIQKPGYIYHYPFQLNLTFIYQLLFSVFHTQSYRLLQYLNIISILLTIYFGYRIVNELTRNPVVQISYIILSFTFMPMFIYSQFVYSDLFLLAMTNIGIWSLLRWFQDKRVRYGVIVVLTAMCANLLRMNYGVILIAVSIAIIYHAAKKKSWRPLILLALCAAVPLSASQMIKMYYSGKSGLEISRGMPVSYYLHGAMQEGSDGPGTFNMRLFIDYGNVADYDYDYYDMVQRAAIKVRIRDFLANPKAIPDFYRRKLMQQWNDYTFSSLCATHVVGDNEMGDIEWSVYYGNLNKLFEWHMDRCLFVFYLSFSIGTVVLWRQKRELYEYVPLIAFIGGFLFSLLFETKGRYVMPYVVLVQPFASMGLAQCVYGLEKIKKIARKKISLS